MGEGYAIFDGHGGACSTVHVVSCCFQMELDMADLETCMEPLRELHRPG